MRFDKSRFWYTKSERNGILILATLITLMQVLLHFTDEIFAPSETAYSDERWEEISRQLDSLEKQNPPQTDFKIYPFNPNFISDYKGYLLGMSVEEIDRLHEFRATGKYLNSAQEFQKITGVNDSLLNIISVHFKFPHQEFNRKNSQVQLPSKPSEKKDLNTATRKDFQEIRGIGEVLSNRIVSYRELLGGFSFEDQLNEVYNLPDEVIEKLLLQFEIKAPPQIQKLNINSASFKEILSVPYIDYDLTRKIMDFRRQEKLITDLAEIKEIDSFPIQHYDRIAVYLLAE